MDGAGEMLKMGVLWASEGFSEESEASGVLRGAGVVRSPAVKQSLRPVAGLNVHF